MSVVTFGTSPLACASLSGKPRSAVDAELAMEPYARHGAAIDAYIARHYRPVQVIGDGNCLFRALSIGLFGDESQHERVRRETCAYLEREDARGELPHTDELAELMSHEADGSMHCLQPGKGLRPLQTPALSWH